MYKKFLVLICIFTVLADTGCSKSKPTKTQEPSQSSEPEDTLYMERPLYLEDFELTSSTFGPYYLNYPPTDFGLRILVWGKALSMDYCSLEAEKEKYTMKGVGVFEIVLNDTELGEYRLITQEELYIDEIGWEFHEEKLGRLIFVRGGESISDAWDSLNQYSAYKGSITVDGQNGWSFEDGGKGEDKKIQLRIHAGFAIADARTLQCDDLFEVDGDGGVTGYRGECVCLEPDGKESRCTNKESYLSCCPDPDAGLAFVDYEIESIECGWNCIQNSDIEVDLCAERYTELYGKGDTDESCNSCESQLAFRIILALSWADGMGPVDPSLVSGSYSHDEKVIPLEPRVCPVLPDDRFCTTMANGLPTTPTVNVHLVLADGRTADYLVEHHWNGCQNGVLTYQRVTVDNEPDGGAITFEQPEFLEPCSADGGWM